MKSLPLAIALLLPSIAFAQGTAVPASPAPATRAVKPAQAPAAAGVAKKPTQATPDVLDISQILGVRQIDPATYEIDARLQNGNEIHLRANAFVMQSLGAQLGTYGR